MKNKIELKKLLLKVVVVSMLILLLASVVYIIEYNTYTRNFNNKISSLIKIIEEKYPNVTQNEIIEIINNQDKETSDILKNYNIDINNESIVLENDEYLHRAIIFNSVFLLTVIVILSLLFLKFNKDKDKDISEITKYIEEINKKNYKLNIDEISEDELSILKNEIYKTTIMLKEQAENSNKEKLELKTSLSDISHQLKTPLTSILVVLDNLIDDNEMDKKTRDEFIFDIKREINNINFLIQSLLKLSKLDTNTITFIDEKISLKDIIEESITKLSMLCDLKKVNIVLNAKEDICINCDRKWQVEAITNILKNCIEHSKENSSVDVEIEGNKIYSQITIRDYGTGIDKNDIPHIFERFYKGKNSSSDSVGIGLALAKTIIEKSNGKIQVDSTLNEGSTFIIRYY